jgi:hypothetical protein
MNYPDVPPRSLNLRSVPVLTSEATSSDAEEERYNFLKKEEQTIIVPNFIAGDRADLIFCKHGNYAYVEDEELTTVTELYTVFYSKEEVWKKACHDAVEASGSKNSIDRLSGTIEIACAAKELIDSREWWTPDKFRKWRVGKIQSVNLPINAKLRSIFPKLLYLTQIDNN